MKTNVRKAWLKYSALNAERANIEKWIDSVDDGELLTNEADMVAALSAIDQIDVEISKTRRALKRYWR